MEDLGNCKECGKPKQLKKFSNGVIESLTTAKKRKFCDRECTLKYQRKHRSDFYF